MSERYIYDSLYGHINLSDYIWDLFTCPELQRLREVRLCNINSLCLPGGANINRFEHAVGTCYLAQECIKEWPPLNPIYENEQKHLIIAALFHDATSGPFGHSFEYLEEKKGFDHEKGVSAIAGNDSDSGYKYKFATFEPIFLGLNNDLINRIGQKDLKEITKIIKGEGRLGSLLNSTMDLDNIDNVYRMAYHMGLIKLTDTPLQLARSLWIENGRLTVKNDAIPLIEEWHNIRKKLYKLLLLNPEEFSAKCMLTDAIELAKRSFINPFNWYDTDYVLINKLANIKERTDLIPKKGLSDTHEIQDIAQRLMTGNLYGCAGIYSSSRYDLYKQLLHFETKTKFEQNINEKLRASRENTTIKGTDKRFIDSENKHNISSKMKSPQISIHPIKDVNKTERQVKIHTENGNEISIGNRLDRLLVGVFLKNKNLNIYKMDKLSVKVRKKMEQDIKEVLKLELDDPDVITLDQHGEINEI